MYCTNCGAKIEDSAAFCPYCGTPARNREQIPPVTEPPESGRPLSAQSTAIRIASLGSNVSLTQRIAHRTGRYIAAVTMHPTARYW